MRDKKGEVEGERGKIEKSERRKERTEKKGKDRIVRRGKNREEEENVEQ